MKQQKSLHKVLAENIGFVFVLPWLIGFLLFKVYPFASSLYYRSVTLNLFPEGISELLPYKIGRASCRERV